MSLRELGSHLDVSAPFMHDVEHNRRRLAPRYWSAIAHALPGLTVRALADAFVSTGRIEVEASMLTDHQRDALAFALTKEAWRAAAA